MGNEASVATDASEEGMGLQSPSTRAIDSEVRRRLAKGVQYNLKIVIRGDRNTGKTQLWRRLQGQAYSPAYTPTDQIQIATINWNYKMSSDVIKLDAWDVVDRAPKRKNQAGMTDSGLKIANTQMFDASELNGDDYVEEEVVDEDGVAEGARHNEFNIGSVVPAASPAPGSPHMKNGSYSVGALDASVVDVMRGATGCILMFDMTKKWTWEYVTRELPKVAKKGIQVLVVGNFRDMGESGRVVSTATAKAFCLTVGDNVHYVEASMKNGYGVRAIAAFFSLPFLDLQKKYIDEQLRRNQEENEAALTEIKALSEELTYDMYLKQLADRKAAKATTPPPQPAKQPEPEPQQQQQPQSPPPAKQQKEKPVEEKKSELPTSLDPDTLKRIQEEEKQRAKEEAKAAKARQEEEKRKAKEEEKRRKEEARKAEQYNKAHAKELEAKRKKQAEEDAAAAEELKKLAAQQKTTQKQDSGSSTTLSSVDDFKITDDGWLNQSMGAADDDGWLVTPEGKNTGKKDPFAFGADDDDEDGAFGGKLGDDDDEMEQKPKAGKKKGKKHKQAFLADSDDL